MREAEARMAHKLALKVQMEFHVYRRLFFMFCCMSFHRRHACLVGTTRVGQANLQLVQETEVSVGPVGAVIQQSHDFMAVCAPPKPSPPTTKPSFIRFLH